MILSEARRDVLTELINVGLGHAAGVLHDMISRPVRLEVPQVDLLTRQEIELGFTRRFGERISSVSLDFSGGFSGKATLVLPDASVTKLVAALHGLEWDPRGEVPPLPEEADPVGDLQEIGNVLINSVIGALSNSFKQQLEYSVPMAVRHTVHDLVSGGLDSALDRVLVATTDFTIENLQLDGSITLLFQVGSVEKLMEALDSISFGS
jgi:chemotaxis protein CheC